MVPLQDTKTLPLIPRELEPGDYTDCEISITGPAGSLFIYKTDVPHRGSSRLGERSSRFVMLVDFQSRGRPWTGKMIWPGHALSGRWRQTMTRMSTRERALFGFPGPGDPYLDEQTLRDVGLRNTDMDMTPDRDAARAG